MLTRQHLKKIYQRIRNILIWHYWQLHRKIKSTKSNSFLKLFSMASFRMSDRAVRKCNHIRCLSFGWTLEMTSSQSGYVHHCKVSINQYCLYSSGSFRYLNEKSWVLALAKQAPSQFVKKQQFMSA